MGSKYNFINNLKKLSLSQNDNEFIKEWLIVYEGKSTNDYEQRCICNRKIKNYYLAKNINNFNYVKMGDGCKKKIDENFEIDTRENTRKRNIIKFFNLGIYIEIDDLNIYVRDVIYEYINKINSLNDIEELIIKFKNNNSILAKLNNQKVFLLKRDEEIKKQDEENKKIEDKRKLKEIDDKKILDELIFKQEQNNEIKKEKLINSINIMKNKLKNNEKLNLNNYIDLYEYLDFFNIENKIIDINKLNEAITNENALENYNKLVLDLDKPWEVKEFNLDYYIQINKDENKNFILNL